MSYAFSASSMKFVIAAVNARSGNLRFVFSSDMFPNHYAVSESSLVSVTVDQENHSFDMAYTQLKGPLFYVKKYDFRVEDLENDFDDQRYLTVLPI